jgi:hypothetical protein
MNDFGQNLHYKITDKVLSCQDKFVISVMDWRAIKLYYYYMTVICLAIPHIVIDCQLKRSCMPPDAPKYFKEIKFKNNVPRF